MKKQNPFMTQIELQDELIFQIRQLIIEKLEEKTEKDDNESHTT